MLTKALRFIVVFACLLGFLAISGQQVLADGDFPPATPVIDLESGISTPHRQPYHPKPTSTIPEEVSKASTIRLEVFLEDNKVKVFGYPADTEITIEILDNTGTTLFYEDTVTSDGSGYAELVVNYDIVPNLWIAASVPALYNHMIVDDVTLSYVVHETDVFGGKTAPGNSVTVGYRDPIDGIFYTTGATVGGTGNFTADFTPIVDVLPFGVENYAWVTDNQGFETISTEPILGVRPQWDEVIFEHFSVLNDVNLRIYDNSTNMNVIYGPTLVPINDSWQAETIPLDLEVGNLIGGTDVATSVGKGLEIVAGSIDIVDHTTDMIIGTAPPDTFLKIVISDWWSYSHEFYVYSYGSGDWDLDLDGIYDLQLEDYVELFIPDESGDYTWYYWEAPYMEVDPYDWSHFYNFTPDNQINLWLYEDDAQSNLLWYGQIETNSDGYAEMYFTDFGCVYIQDGNYLVAEDVGTGFVKELSYEYLRILDINETGATVHGIGPPNEWVQVITNDQNGWKEIWLETDGTGVFTADFGAEGSTLIDSENSLYKWDHDRDKSLRYRSARYADWPDFQSQLYTRSWYDGGNYNACYGQDIHFRVSISADSDLEAFLDSNEVDIWIDGEAQFSSYNDAHQYFTYPPIGNVVFWGGSGLLQWESSEYIYPLSTLSAGPHEFHVRFNINDGGVITPFYESTYTINVMPSASPDSLSGLNGAVEIVADQPIVAIGRPHIGQEIMSYNSANQGATEIFLPMLFNNTWGSYTSSFTIQNTSRFDAIFNITFSDALTGAHTCTIYDESLPRHGVRTYDVTNLPSCIGGTGMDSGWYGGARIESDQPVTAIAKPEVGGTDIVTYNGFTEGANTQYLPMLFRGIYANYQAAFYVQNLDAVDAEITIDFYDADGNYTCAYTDPDLLVADGTRGYWMLNINNDNCTGGTGFDLVNGWAGSAVITASSGGTPEVVAIGRPHMGTEVAAYNGFTGGNTTNYLPMLFRGQWGYNAAIYIQNVSGVSSNLEIEFYDTEGNYTCTYTDSDLLPSNATRGYWTPAMSCTSGGSFPATGWAGSAKVTSSQDVIAVGRPHLSNGQVVVYNAFTNGETDVFVPSLFRNYGNNQSALYIQNLGLVDTTATIRFYDEESGFYCQMEQVVTPGSAGAIWLAALDNSLCVPETP